MIVFISFDKNLNLLTLGTFLKRLQLKRQWSKGHFSKSNQDQFLRFNLLISFPIQFLFSAF